MASTTSCDRCHKKQDKKGEGWVVVSLRGEVFSKLPHFESAYIHLDLCPSCGSMMAEAVKKGLAKK